MVRHLTREEVVTTQVLSRRGVSQRRIASHLGVTEEAVRCRLKREREGRPDGRCGKPRLASGMVPQIEAWLEEYGREDRPTNVRALYEYLVGEHGYEHSYKSVLRYVRARWGRPATSPAETSACKCGCELA